MSKAILKNVCKNFGETKVLKNIDLTISDGEFIAFVGPSGSGKSTLLRVISGLETATSGNIVIGTKDVTELPAGKRNISMVFQNYALYPHMTVAKNITFGMRLRKEPKEVQKKQLVKVATMLHLEELLERKPRQLSGGQRQRVAMARAIVRTPELFLMDEPLSNLDAKLRNEVRLSVMQLHKDLGCTMVYVTHDQIEAMTMADRIAVLKDGIIQQIGTPQQLYHQPQNLFVAGFIGTPAMNAVKLKRDGYNFFLPDHTPIPIPQKLLPQINDTDSISLGIRPEHIFEHNHNNQQTSTTYETFTPHYLSPKEEAHKITVSTTISSSEMLGSEFLLHTQNESGGFKYKIANHGQVPKQGESTEIQFFLKHTHLFNTDSGVRLL